jgi:hypothetical protein
MIVLSCFFRVTVILAVLQVVGRIVYVENCGKNFFGIVIAYVGELSIHPGRKFLR